MPCNSVGLQSVAQLRLEEGNRAVVQIARKGGRQISALSTSIFCRAQQRLLAITASHEHCIPIVSVSDILAPP